VSVARASNSPGDRVIEGSWAVKSGNQRGPREFRPQAERMEARLVMSGRASVAAEVRAILHSSPGGTPIRPNTPVLPLEAPTSTASFIDPSTQIIRGARISIGQKDYVAPFVSMNGTAGYIKIGSSSSLGDNTTLVANPTRAKGVTGIFIGDNVAVASGVSVTGPAAIGTIGGAAVSIGANAVIDGAVIRPGAFVGALARVGPGVTINTGIRVLPGANVTNQAEATNPTLGKVVASTSTAATAATSLVVRGVALAGGYANVYQGNSATGNGASGTGPVPSPLSATGSTIFFGALNTVLGVSSEPTSRFVPFEPATGTPTFRSTAGVSSSVPQNLSYSYPERIIGGVQLGQPYTGSLASFSRRDSIRGDEGQPIVFNGPIDKLGNAVSIHSPLGGVRSTTTTTVVTATTAAGVTTTATTTATNAAPTATAGTTTATTTGRNAAGVATTGTVTTTIANTTANLGGITVGTNFRAGDNATILGGPSQTSVFGDNVSVGSGAVVDTSNLGSNVTIGARTYVANSTLPAGTIVPDGALIINNQYLGQIQY